ncbi:MAG: LPP20 family lipoprotein [Treponema sp.]|uniref:LPP20 family lipoprotein n=1 Tax=Treponema sp. TaxID=166 RepID=UPI00298E61F9|nr:LPP20 family lipoprotein [Treponema sp.]MCQ2602067.1 LPP20 family lipoprotein [Treponema sp.]
MKKICISLILVLLYSSLCFSEVPKWLVNLEKEFPTKNYISAVGSGNSEYEAKQDALTKLSSYFSVSVESKTNAHNSQTRNNSTYSTNSSIDQDTSIFTNSDLFTIHYTPSYFDKEKKKYSVCAYIGREEASDIINGQIAFLYSLYSHNIMFIEYETDDFRKILIMNDALYNSDRIFKLNEYLRFIDSERALYWDDYISQVNEVKNEMRQLKRNNPVSVFSTGDYSEQIKNIVSEILTENGYVIARNADYKINANTTSIISSQISKSHEIYSTTPSIYISLEDNSETISSCLLSSERISSYTKETLTGMALYALEDLLRNNLTQNLLR